MEYYRSPRPLHRRLPFPNRTQGFFYYHNPLRNIPTTGELRFRTTTSNDPSTFASGTDLLSPKSLPWRIPLQVIAKVKYLSGLRQFLLEDDHVTAEVMQQCAQSYDDAAIKPHQKSRFIHSFGQVFNLEFSSCRLSLFVVTSDSCRKLQISKLLLRHEDLIPFSGKSIKKI
jgi:hypothetical protein